MVEKTWQQAGRQGTRCIHLQESDKENMKSARLLVPKSESQWVTSSIKALPPKGFITFQIVALVVNQVLIYRQEDISHSTYSCELNNLYYYPIYQGVSMTWNLFIYVPKGYLCLCFTCEGTPSMQLHIQHFKYLFWGQKSSHSQPK